MNATQFYVQQEARKYTQRLDAWVNQVTLARNHIDAFRFASQTPPEGHMSAVIRPVTSGDKQRALSKIERSLEKRLTEMTIEDLSEHQDLLRRCTQGRYPRLFQRIVATLMVEK